jgi:hypothetical protein
MLVSCLPNISWIHSQLCHVVFDLEKEMEIRYHAVCTVTIFEYFFKLNFQSESCHIVCQNATL